ncbi:hypothetical protein AARI_24890 [Glutamicibacter arilaitensis Re117]|uniref:Uncharacterized protein n=1 Tax=Glutamicibacter arilaitensis (strain DSM 16368 / CIP 108037 / IAM 15318 / JCM 13566 / NCIMB 14258 / Re117) TaxID=861360 RepID=A0ABM9PZF8_GLUAR|nr:hypothetical protein AARI_24890 [Glutamicibacter arilaitensis Re117]
MNTDAEHIRFLVRLCEIDTGDGLRAMDSGAASHLPL